MSFENYEEYEDMLLDYVTGDLPEDESDALEAELSRSEYLRQELRRYERLAVSSPQPPEKR